MYNVYYSPEKFGLEVVAELEFSDLDYQFDTRVVWKDKDGVLFTARDSGCSCPCPFEDYASVESLDRLDMKELEAECEYRGGGYGGNPDFRRDAAEFLSAVRAAL